MSGKKNIVNIFDDNKILERFKILCQKPTLTIQDLKIFNDIKVRPHLIQSLLNITAKEENFTVYKLTLIAFKNTISIDHILKTLQIAFEEGTIDYIDRVLNHHILDNGQRIPINKLKEIYILLVSNNIDQEWIATIYENIQTYLNLNLENKDDYHFIEKIYFISTALSNIDLMEVIDNNETIIVSQNLRQTLFFESLSKGFYKSFKYF